MAGPSVRLDLRAALPIAALGVVVLVIIFVELCGREDVSPVGESTPFVELATATPITPGPTATPGPTFTPGPSPTAAPVTATATREAPIGGGERDIARVQDLADLQEALEQYREEHGSYPDSGGNIQTLCAFTEFDAGCELEEVLSPLPQDPLGDQVNNGYWYTSIGSRFAVFAQRESEQFEECSEHPDFLRDFDSLLCVQGP
jgi:hypothetical protein